MYRDDQFANLSVTLQNAMPLDTQESAKSSGVLSSLNSLSSARRTGYSSGRHFFGHNSTAAIARELFKPSTDLASLLVSTEKKKVLGLGFSWGEVTSFIKGSKDSDGSPSF